MNTKYIPIHDLGKGRIGQVFMVHKVDHKDTMTTATNAYFARVILKDVTGEISGVIWNYDPNYPLIEGQFYYMEIDMSIYRDNLEFACQNDRITYVEDPPNINDYIQSISESMLDSYATVIESALESMDDEHYKNVLGNAIGRLDLIHALKNSPYGLDGPLACRGGLLIHIASAIKIANTIIAHAKEHDIKINHSLVVMSCIFRNIGWHTTTAFIEHRLRPRDAYYVVGVNRASARYVDHLMIHVEADLEMSVPEEKRQALENACYDMQEIKTVEGRIAASIDAMTNLLHHSNEILEKGEGSWSNEWFVGHNRSGK